MKKTYVAALAGAGLVTLAMSGSAMAFHDGGVAKCEGCHTMHTATSANNSSNKEVVVGAMLLQGSESSSACLNCHGKGTTTSGYHVSTDAVTFAGLTQPAQFTPGGDFSWIKRSSNSNSNRKGHNIVSTTWGYAADTVTAAPGGTYPSAGFACASCHDPHGKYRVLDDYTVAKTGAPIMGSGSYGDPVPADEATGTYRFLAGNGYTLKSQPSAPAFTTNPPVAVAPKSYNLATVLGGVRVGYSKGMSEWCSNCHTDLHSASGAAGLRHPAGNGSKLTQAIADNYNAYVKSGDMTGTSATAWNSMVPVEKGLVDSTDNRATLKGLVLDGFTASTEGVTTGDNVMCLSCHRAHASGFDSMLRWYQNDALMVDEGVYTIEKGLTNAADMKAAFYNLEPTVAFASFQRGLCNKCHAKD